MVFICLFVILLFALRHNHLHCFQMLAVRCFIIGCRHFAQMMTEFSVSTVACANVRKPEKKQ